MRRATPPGVHGPKGYGKLTEYGQQLREKQKAKYMYGVMEGQFRRYYEAAIRQTGNTADLFLQHLERRLDNAVYRIGLTTTRAEARQLVSHGWVTVNGKRVDVPSFEVSVDDTISVKPTAAKHARWKETREQRGLQPVPSWLMVSDDGLTGKVVAVPVKDDFPQNLNMTLIVEFYSR